MRVHNPDANRIKSYTIPCVLGELCGCLRGLSDLRAERHPQMTQIDTDEKPKRQYLLAWGTLRPESVFICAICG